GSPAHLAVDDTDSFLYVSNYCGGNIAVIAVSPEGSLQSPCQVVQHISDPIAPCEQSQGTSHVHEVTFSSNRSVLVNDLGHNQIFEYAVDADGLLVTPPVAVTHSPRSGAGPRHSLIHPSGRYAFVINELSSSMTSYYYDSSCASLGSEIMTISTLRPDENATDMAAAELQISSNGKYLYGSNRDISSPNLGRNSIVVFAVDEVSGMLKTLQHVDTRGEHPRFFNFFLNETVLLVGNMNSNTIATFLVGNDTGTLTPVNADEMTSVDAPTHMVKYR
ncbi:pgl, partial [Symbiodinium microadriaticum]